MRTFSYLVVGGVIFCFKLLPMFAWIIPTPTTNQISIINDVTVEILMKCYADHRAIVVPADSDEGIITSMRDAEFFPVDIFTASSQIESIPRLQFKPNLLVITSDSETQLENILNTFKQSTFWHAMIPTFIIESADIGCDNAENLLKTVWKLSLIKSNYLCMNADQTPMIYTYNPYTNRAPQPWQQIVREDGDSPGWTMLVRPYNEENICTGLDFDRTAHLDGAIVKVTVQHHDFTQPMSSKWYDDGILLEWDGYDIDMLIALKTSWNVTLVITEYEINDDPKNKVDVSMVLTGVSPYSAASTMTYPSSYSDFHIVTNNLGFYTPWEKIQNYYGLMTLISMCIILSLTYIVIVMSEKTRRWSFAGFKLLRLLINAGLYTRINTRPLRIFFSIIFLHFLIIQATFQGHLSAFLTKDEYRANAEKIADLQDSRYEAVHVNLPVASTIKDSIVRKKLRYGNIDCSQNIFGKNSEACISDADLLLKTAFEHNLHVSKQPLGVNVYTYLTRRDWPLKEKFDIFLMRWEQSGHLDRYYDILTQQETARQKRIRAVADVDTHPISMTMLGSFFVIWLIGLMIATICFFLKSKSNAFSQKSERIGEYRRNFENIISFSVLQSTRFSPVL